MLQLFLRSDQDPEYHPRGVVETTNRGVGSGWKSELLDLLHDRWAPHEPFSLGEVYEFADLLASRHPENLHIEEKIRQLLQQLRDESELKFEAERGTYSIVHPVPVPNDPVLAEPGPELRAQLLMIRDLYGKILSSSELQGLVKGFSSQKGIYKPSGSPHALWIRQTARGRYPDAEPEVFPDGSWRYLYSPEDRGGGLDLSLDTNRALLKCQEDNVPVGVFRQTEDVNGKAAYDALGLAFVESFDGTHFVLRGEGIDVAEPPLVEVVRPTFTPFEVESSRRSPSLRVVRAQRFAVALRKLYGGRCSLCTVGYQVSGRLIGLDAAHIIPVENRGITGDVRNGLLLCKNHHALFDQYAWTLDADLHVVVAPDRGLRRSAVGNHILTWESKRLPNLPKSKADYPAAEAIAWRRSEFDRTWG